MTTKVIMANDLINGDVIFLSRDLKNWTKYMDQAWVSESEQLVEQMLNRAQESHMIIGAEIIDVKYDQYGPTLTVFREYIRSKGPSVRTDLGKQAVLRAV